MRVTPELLKRKKRNIKYSDYGNVKEFFQFDCKLLV